MATLYQSGALPKKFLMKALPSDIGMILILLNVVMNRHCGCLSLRACRTLVRIRP